MNANAVISWRAEKQEIGFGSRFGSPVFSILDPAKTYTVPSSTMRSST
ncbi:MAG: hypothetical protein GW949_06470 [Spirochaetales bacterium]|nr:hypothetical protein [Spirochaetales bacterium]